MNIRLALLAGLGFMSMNAFAADLEVGSFFQNGAGDVVRINSMHHAHSQVANMGDVLTITGSDGHEYTQHDAYSANNFSASTSRDFIAVEIPARNRSESNRVEIKLISQVIRNNAGQIQAYLVNETSGRTVIQADELKLQRAQVVSADNLPGFIRSRPIRSIVNVTLGSLVELHKRFVTENDGLIVRIVDAAEKRSNYSKSRLAKNLNLFYDASVDHVNELTKLLKQSALDDARDAKGDVGISGTGSLAAKAVEAAEGAR